MRKKEDKWEMEPQKSSAAQFITYIASTGQSSEKYELRYEEENIWMSQKTMAAVYGVEVPNIAYHLRKIFADAELDKGTCIKEILIDVGDGHGSRCSTTICRSLLRWGSRSTMSVRCSSASGRTRSFRSIRSYEH